MNIQSIQSILPIASADKAETVVPKDNGEFGNLLKGIIEQSNETDAVEKAGTDELLAGISDDLHNITINATQAELALSLTIKVRDKVIDAYNEIMRMQV